MDSLRDLGSALDAAAAELGEATLPPTEASTAQTKLNRAIRSERKRFKRLYKEIGAIPVLPGGGGDDGESPAEEETQPA